MSQEILENFSINCFFAHCSASAGEIQECKLKKREMGKIIHKRGQCN